MGGPELSALLAQPLHLQLHWPRRVFVPRPKQEKFQSRKEMREKKTKKTKKTPRLWQKFPSRLEKREAPNLEGGVHPRKQAKQKSPKGLVPCQKRRQLRALILKLQM